MPRQLQLSLLSAQFVLYDTAESWSRVERIIARVEAGPEGTDTPLSSPTSKAAAPSTFTSGSRE